MVFVLNFLNSKVQTRPFILEFSGFYILFNLQLSRFFVVVSFSTARLFYHSCLSLSTTFFILFFVAHQQLNHLIMYHCFCQQLFLFFSNSFLFEPLLSQWNYNITSPSAIVKRICSIFLHTKSQAINAKLYLRNIISSFCTTMFVFCWQICTDCPSFRFALCLFYSFYASLASSFWNSSPEVFHPNISLG